MKLNPEIKSTEANKLALEMSKYIDCIIYVISQDLRNYQILTEYDISCGNIFSSYKNGKCTFDVQDWK